MDKNKVTKSDSSSEQLKSKVSEQSKPLKTNIKPKVKDKWEIKDRTYYLTRDRRPLTATIKSTDIYYFDENMGYERELKHTSNQKTCLVDEMKGDQRLEHILLQTDF